MTLPSTRNIDAAMRAALVDTTGAGFSVLETIQPIYQIEDLSRVIAPTLAPTWVTTWSEPAGGAGVYSKLTVQAPPDSPIIITWIRNDDAVDSLFWGIADADPLAVVTATFIPFVTMGGTPRSVVRRGTGPFQTGVLLAAGAQFDQAEIIVEPGRYFFKAAVLANNAMDGSVAAREFLL